MSVGKNQVPESFLDCLRGTVLKCEEQLAVLFCIHLEPATFLQVADSEAKAESKVGRIAAYR